jgi:S1-C subfamily serine protease
VEVFLDHMKGERAGALDRFTKDVIRVGRQAEFELCFEDLGVSFEHAELRLRDGDYWLVDRGSTNGSYVNEERAYNARLKEGDMLRFGKKGPVLRFRLTSRPEDARVPAVAAPAQAAPAAVSDAPPFDMDMARALLDSKREKGGAVAAEPLGELPPLVAVPAPPKKSRRVTMPNMDALPPQPPAIRVQPVVAAAPSSSGGDSDSSGSDLSAGGSSALDGRRAGERRISVAPREPRAPVFLTALLAFLALAGTTAAVFFCLDADRKRGALDLATARADQAKKELEDLRKATSDREREDQVAAVKAHEETRSLVERLEQSLERERKESKKVETSSRSKIEELQQDLARAKGEIAQLTKFTQQARPNDNGGWKMVTNRVAHSVVLVGCSFNLKKKDGTTEAFSCFGTGFFISRDGNIATNKHVVEPWKFRPLAVRISQEDLEVDMKSYTLSVWIGGTRFANGSVLDVSTGYSTSTKTLERVRVAADRWQTFNIPGERGTRAVQVHHENSNTDLALLKASGGPFEPIPMRRPNEGPLEKLDACMVLGFPAGPQILEKGVAETSPSLGQVRKIEDSIYVSAAIMGGNSGGPLLDNEGRAIGVCTRVVMLPNATEPIGDCIKIEHVIELLEGGSW